MVNSLQSRYQTQLKRSEGFSLFELVVFIIVVAIIYASAARRFSEFPGEAERANFLAVSSQIQTGINLEMMVAMTRGQTFSFREIEQFNPMDLLLDPPSNYLGAFDFVDINSIERRSWYFDLSRRELVYLVNDDEGVFLTRNGQRVPTREIRFRIEAVYSGSESFSSASRSAELALSEDDESSLSFSGRGSVSGLLLAPVIPFEWDSDIMELAGTGVLDG